MEGVVKRSLVAGASGMVGQHCLAVLGESGTGTYCDFPRPGLLQLDVRDVDAFDQVMAEVRPEILYLAACQANVEECERHPELAWKTNVAGVRNAVEVAERHRCKLVFLSSEYVFDGVSGPYRESDPANPLSMYGRQKLAAEHHILLLAPGALIVRTTVVFGTEARGKNFVYRLVSALREGTPIRVPGDQFSSPTYAPDLVRAMIELAEADARGVFHVTGPRVVSRYDFAVLAAQTFGLDPAGIIPVTTAELKQVAPRPLQAGLIVEKVERALGRPMLDFEEGLRELAHAF